MEMFRLTILVAVCWSALVTSSSSYVLHGTSRKSSGKFTHKNNYLRALLERQNFRSHFDSDLTAQQRAATRTGSPTMKLSITADNVVEELFIDGIRYSLPAQSIFTKPDSINIPEGSSIIAVKAVDLGPPGGLLASVENNFFLTDSSRWRCTNRYSPKWWLPEFDDENWPAAVKAFEHSASGRHGHVPPISTKAHWIWTSNFDGPNIDSTVYCRGYFPERCPSNFKHVSSINGCYKVVFESLTWYDAAKKCRQIHPRGHLVVINNEEEQRAIASLGTGHVWTAGQRVDPTRLTGFVWRIPSFSGNKNDRLIAMNYGNWYPGEPNNCGGTSTSIREACLEIHPGNRWNDKSCSAKGPAICEIDI